MSGAFFLQEAIRLRAPAPVDKYGNRVDRDWSSAEEHELTGINLQPEPAGQGVGEEVGDRAVVTSRWRLITPRGRDVDLLPSDRIKALDFTLEVDGEVSRYYVGGYIHHAEVRLKRVEG